MGAKKLLLSSVYSTVSALKGVQNTERFFDFSKRRISERYIILKIRWMKMIRFRLGLICKDQGGSGEVYGIFGSLKDHKVTIRWRVMKHERTTRKHKKANAYALTFVNKTLIILYHSWRVRS